MASPIFVQQAPQVHQNGAGATVLAAIFGSNETAGNTNLVFISIYTATPPAITSIVDTQSNAYTLIGSVTTSDCKTFIYSSPVASSAANTVTVATNSGTSTLIACPITTGHPDEMLVICERLAAVAIITPQGGLTHQTIGASSDSVADMPVSLVGLYNPTFSSNVSGLWTSIAVALQGASPTQP